MDELRVAEEEQLRVLPRANALRLGVTAKLFSSCGICSMTPGSANTWMSRSSSAASLPVDPKASFKLQRRSMHALGVDDSDDENDAGHGSLRVSRQLAPAHSVGGDDNLANIARFARSLRAKVVGHRGHRKNSRNQTILVFFSVSLYILTMVFVVEYSDASFDATEFKDDWGNTCKNQGLDASPWVWLLALDVTYFTILGILCQSTPPLRALYSHVVPTFTQSVSQAEIGRAHV